MSRLTQFAAGIAVAALAALPLAAQASDPTDIIDYRKHVMKTLGEQTAMMNAMLQKKVPDENFAVHAQVLAIAASTALMAFKENVEGGESKPDVWAKWPDFEKRMKELAANTAELAQVAKTGGAAAAAPKMAGALTCRGCHETYRLQKK